LVIKIGFSILANYVNRFGFSHFWVFSQKLKEE